MILFQEISSFHQLLVLVSMSIAPPFISLWSCLRLKIVFKANKHKYRIHNVSV